MNEILQQSLRVEAALERLQALLELASVAMDASESPVTSGAATGFRGLVFDSMEELVSALKGAGLMIG